MEPGAGGRQPDPLSGSGIKRQGPGKNVLLLVPRTPGSWGSVPHTLMLTHIVNVMVHRMIPGSGVNTLRSPFKVNRASGGSLSQVKKDSLLHIKTIGWPVDFTTLI